MLNSQFFQPLQPSTIHNHIHVSIRLKPLSEIELNTQKMRGGPQWFVTNDHTVTDRTAREHFHFDRVFAQDATTDTIFKSNIQPMIQNALKGYNVTILAYGQTSSGKTHTMSGSQSQPGLIQLTGRELFKAIDYLISPEGIRALPLSPDPKENPFIKRQTSLSIQVLEIYNEVVNDLLDPTKRNLEVREQKSGEVFVDQLTQIMIKNESDFIKCFQEAEANRVQAETQANKKSSRSHTICRLLLQTDDTNTQTGRKILRTSQINLVDLAGSEGASKSNTQGLRLREGSAINKSLLALSNVILKLSLRHQTGQKHSYINFRDSKLTRILQNALLGQSQTAIICCVSQLTANTQETLQALYFGQKAKQIKTEVHVNELIKEKPDQIAFQMASMHRQINELRDQVAAKNLALQYADEQAKQFKAIGPLKSHIERLEQQIAQQCEDLAMARIESEEHKQLIAQGRQDVQSLEIRLDQAQQVRQSLQQMYESAVQQNQARDQLVTQLTKPPSPTKEDSMLLNIKGDLEVQVNNDKLEKRLKQVEWESRSLLTQLAKKQAQVESLQQQVHMQKQTTHELFKELDVSRLDQSMDLQRLSFGDNPQPYSPNKSVLLNLLQEQVKHLQSERDQLFLDRELVLKNEHQQQLDEIALTVVNRDKDLGVVYLENEELYDALEEAQNQQDQVQQECADLKKSLQAARQEIERMKQLATKRHLDKENVKVQKQEPRRSSAFWGFLGGNNEATPKFK